MQRTLAEWLDYIERQHPKSIDMGLDRVREVAQRMGLQRPAKKVITVAGTNGKGSTVAFIESIARAAGWKVGAYTSPHLLAYNERVRIDGADATDAGLVAGFEAVEAARGDTPLTYFEYGTLCALWLFQRSKLDLAVLEVGLGGRLDAVNIVDADVAVVTTVDIDHQDWLGNEREAIGFEKAGIARAWKPLVLGEDDPPSSVLGHAYAIGASAIRANCDFFFERSDAGHWRWREVGYSVELPTPTLAAPAQLRNAATAIAALRALGKPISEVGDGDRHRGSARGRPPAAFRARRDRGHGRCRPQPAGGARTGRMAAAIARIRAHVRGIRRAGRQGRGRRGRGAGRAHRPLVPGGAGRGGAARRGRRGLRPAPRRVPRLRPAANMPMSPPRSPRHGPRPARAIASSSSVPSTPWRRLCAH